MTGHNGHPPRPDMATGPEPAPVARRSKSGAVRSRYGPNGLEYPEPPPGLSLVPCDVAGCGCEGLVPRIQTTPAQGEGSLSAPPPDNIGLVI